MATYQGKILARSPFFITATGSTYIESAELKVFIWSGGQAVKPASAQYTINKNALTSNSTNIIFEISALIKDYFEHNRDAYIDTLGTFTDALWVETELSVVQTTDPQPSVINNIYLAVDGLGYFEAEENPQGTNVIVNTLNINNGEPILLPVYANSDGIDTVEWLFDGVVQATTDLSAAVASLNSYDKLQYLTDSTHSDEVRLYRSTVLQETITVNYIDECKYTPRKVKFYDANGALQQIYMFKASRESLNVKKENYNSIIGSVVSNQYQYSSANHQVKDYNVTGSEKITLNTGFVGEEQNEVIRQLLLSELVWVDDKPVSITSNSLEYQTRVNDKLINYTLSFDYAYNKINNVY